ncbi:MAG: ferric reductase-like transmembrane domain-containing protein [Actinobacteria bacterium]|nr:ferric reductase-like transmembrane domain-containing protein [Actinomycetota bacterium]
MNEKLSWYISRSSGWVAFVLLAVTVVWGILGITKIIERRGLPKWLIELHRYLAMLSLVFTAIHLAGLVGDNYMHVAWREILVPYALDYRSGAVALGIVALYLLVVVQVSSWLRPHLPRKLWKGLHMLSYPAMWLVAMHGLRAGTDASNLAVRAGVMVVVGLTSLLILLRIVRGRTVRRQPRTEPARTEAARTLALVPPSGRAAVRAVPSGAPAEQIAYIREAMESLREALDTLQQATPDDARHSAPVTVERRRQARTLVDDASPSA